jgi:hypothetical protein
VIREAMRGKGMVALGRLVLSKRERVIACSLCRPTNFWRRERASGCPDISRTDKLGAANSLTSLSRNRGRSRADEYPGRRRSRARAPKRRLRVFQSGMLPDSRALQKINSRREDGRCSRGTRVLPKRALKGNLTLATWRGKVRDFLQDDLGPVSKSFEEDNEAGKLDKAEEIVGVVLPANEDPALPLNPGEEALDEPASHVAA